MAGINARLRPGRIKHHSTDVQQRPGRKQIANRQISMAPLTVMVIQSNLVGAPVSPLGRFPEMRRSHLQTASYCPVDNEPENIAQGCPVCDFCSDGMWT